MALIKREILTRRKVLSTKSCTRNQLVLQKDAFQNTDFSRLKWQLKRKKKKRHTFFVTISQVSADEGMGK